MYTLGVDIGTFETKGVLVDFAGRIVAQAVRAHEMIVPRAGWAEHRPEEDWWGDFVFITKALLKGIDPTLVKAVASSAIGPCMLPLDADGRAVDERGALRGGHAGQCGNRFVERGDWARMLSWPAAAMR